MKSLVYLLADSMYLYWTLFSKPIKQTKVTKEKKFSNRQEAVRNYVERLFAVLKTIVQSLRSEMMILEPH